MGMYDSVEIYQPCPGCGTWQMFDWQTKDLDSQFYTYRPLPEDWLTATLGGKIFRMGLGVFPKFPMDKEHTVWKDQAERREAQATLLPPYDKQLRFVKVHGICEKCKKYWELKVEVKDGKLWGIARELEV